MVKQEGTARYFSVRRKHREFVFSVPVLRHEACAVLIGRVYYQYVATPSLGGTARQCTKKRSIPTTKHTYLPMVQVGILTDPLAPRCRRAPIFCVSRRGKDGRSSFVTRHFRYGAIHMVILYDA